MRGEQGSVGVHVLLSEGDAVGRGGANRDSYSAVRRACERCDCLLILLVFCGFLNFWK